MSKTTILVASALAALPCAALAGGPVATAEEPIVVAPAPAERASTDWTGFYLGVQATNYSGTAEDSGTIPASYDLDATLGGVHGGYLHDFGRLVLGAEIEVETGSNNYTFADSGAPTTLSLERSTTLKIKAGADLGRVLAYGMLGVTRADTGNSSGLDDKANGDVFGIGVSAMFSDNFIGGIEFSRKKYDPFDGNPVVEQELDTISLRLSYKF